MNNCAVYVNLIIMPEIKKQEGSRSIKVGMPLHCKSKRYLNHLNKLVLLMASPCEKKNPRWAKNATIFFTCF
jgi:hypothetical protein